VFRNELYKATDDPVSREQLLRLAKFQIREVESEPSRARVMLSVIGDELQAAQNALDKSGPRIVLPSVVSNS
jgi:hypothetical protein